MVDQPSLFDATTEGYPSAEHPPCLCCGEPIIEAGHSFAGDLDGIPLCAACLGASFVEVGTRQDKWGYKGAMVTESEFELVCPSHGAREPVDVLMAEGADAWHRATSKKTGKRYRIAYPVTMRSGKRLTLLDYEVVR